MPSNNNYAFMVHETGFIADNALNYYQSICPTVSLNADVAITDGSGTDLDPYILS